jgi:SPP1 gp7 family putative phage head morphogenesis protein
MQTKSVNKAYKKMKRRGIVTPTIKLTDMTTKSVSELYKLNLDELESLVVKNLKEYNVPSKKGVLVKDSLEGLVSYLQRLGKESTFVKKIIGNIEVLINSDKDLYHYEKLKKRLRNQFGEVSDHFFKDLYEDADDELVTRLVRFALDKNDVFEKRIADLKELYINNAIERINGEQNSLKERFLQRLVDWSTNKTEDLDVKDIIKEMKKTSVREARFFARDQFCKFNKALLISSFRAAGVKTVRLITCQDAAVRPDHKDWNKKIFDIENIPYGWWNDYNCRCGAIAIWD